MEITLNIGNSVILHTGLLGIITSQMEREAGEEELWFEIRDENGQLDHFPRSKFQPDLFEHYDSLPDNVKEVLDKYGEEDETYANCANMLLELEAIGYTFDYYLDACPYALRKK